MSVAVIRCSSTRSRTPPPQIIKTVGNDNSNKIWEARLAESTEFQKITSSIDRYDDDTSCS